MREGEEGGGDGGERQSHMTVIPADQLPVHGVIVISISVRYPTADH